MYKLKYRRQARNYLAKLPFKIKSRIIDKLHEIQKNPDGGLSMKFLGDEFLPVKRGEASPVQWKSVKAEEYLIFPVVREIPMPKVDGDGE